MKIISLRLFAYIVVTNKKLCVCKYYDCQNYDMSGIQYTRNDHAYLFFCTLTVVGWRLNYIEHSQKVFFRHSFHLLAQTKQSIYT